MNLIQTGAVDSLSLSLPFQFTGMFPLWKKKMISHLEDPISNISLIDVHGVFNSIIAGSNQSPLKSMFSNRR